jgi:hypothetical protein
MLARSGQRLLCGTGFHIFLGEAYAEKKAKNENHPKPHSGYRLQNAPSNIR